MQNQKDVDSLVAPLEALNFLHQDYQYINKQLNALQAYHLMTGNPPFWLRIAFKIRDFLSLKLAGVQPIQGFGSPKAQTVKVNDKLDFFDVIKITETELFLQSADKHLRVLVALQIHEHDHIKNKLSVTTSVVTYNFFGKVYMLPVSLVHGLIVRNSLKNLN
ncbi:DUF2867 domain-containing protein [Acinetobacter colistiniresistens]|uniref:DUF2867 domain-containing protein n=1 Tax=Acinetobacter colistiniresistens TaxID=280145 RepID=S3UE16_9GAMM|nr:DUF2867 domain-containing protein [Acinetobacter colistiniresistens]EPG37762.1 hypothetical protein F907_01732 [Acinetobacter colistiniresistens]TVT76079.1 DUF2867 domain-containing protein [Acinetobacter colistiniresistens]